MTQATTEGDQETATIAITPSLTQSKSSSPDTKASTPPLPNEESSSITPETERIANGDAEKGQSPTAALDNPPGDEAEATLIRAELGTLHAVGLAATMLMAVWMMTVQTGGFMIIIPVIANWYETSTLKAQWVVSAFALAEVSGLLVSGRLADLYGRKHMFLIGMVICFITNIVAPSVPDIIGVCVVRAIAGLGLAIAAPAAVGIIGTTFRTEPRRTYAFAAWGLGAPMGAATGEVLAGVVADAGRGSWRNIFYVVAGCSAVPIISGYFLIPAEPTRSAATNRRLDWAGAVLITVSLSLFSFSLTQSGIDRNGWKAPYIPATLGVSLLLLLMFGFWERYLERNTTLPPIVKLSVFTRHHWRVTIVLLIEFLVWCGVCGWVTLSGIWFQTLEGRSPLDTALRIIPGDIFGLFWCYMITVLALRVRTPILLIGSALSIGLGNLLMAVQPWGWSYWKLSFLSALCHPAGGDVTVPIASILISNLVHDDEQSVGGALSQVAIQFGNTLDTCISSLIYTQVGNSSSLLTGARAAYWFNVACCFTVIPVILVSLWRVGLARDVAQVV